MFAYLLTLIGVLGHAIPHPGLPFTAVGGSLLNFGARRPLWQATSPSPRSPPPTTTSPPMSTAFPLSFRDTCSPGPGTPPSSFWERFC